MIVEINRKGSRAVAMQMGLILVVLLWTSAAASGQTNNNARTPTTAAIQSEQRQTPKAMKPALQDYKDIKIGSTADEVRDRLGKAVIDDKDGFYYEFDDTEIVQIRLDSDKTIRLISVTYASQNKDTPKLEEVFGSDTSAKPRADGMIYKLVRYPEAGYWVAYSRTAGEKPTVTVTMQKL